MAKAMEKYVRWRHNIILSGARCMYNEDNYTHWLSKLFSRSHVGIYFPLHLYV